MHTKTSKRTRTLLLFTILLLLFVMIAFQQELTLRTYTLHSEKIHSNIRLLSITDLHSTFYGKNQKDLIKRIHQIKPDCILLVGDIADDIRPLEGTIALLASIAQDYPCFYVTGNHETFCNDIQSIKQLIASYGITVLEGTTKSLDIKNQTITISGVDDPLFFGTPSLEWSLQLNACNSSVDDSFYSLLLSHRPELVNYYANSKFDLVLAGHAHGGQFRIPYVLNGLYAPNQGTFPKYAGGLYTLNQTTMIVSRGLCKNKLPRLFNPPELVVIDLKPISKH